MSDLSRRDLLKSVAAASAGIGLAQLGFAAPADAEPTAPVAESMMGVRFEPRDVPRIAIVGTGLRGRSVLGELLGVGNVRITALCDIVPEKVEMAKAQMKSPPFTPPANTISRSSARETTSISSIPRRRGAGMCPWFSAP